AGVPPGNNHSTPQMLYNSRRPLNRPGSREHSRPPTPRHRLLHSRLGNHGGCGLARHHGRLAAPRRRTRRIPRFRNRRSPSASDRMGIRQTRNRHARRGWRNSLYHRGLFAPHQFRHRLDDDARLFHRLPLGSRRRRPHRRLHHPRLDSLELYRIAGRPVFLPHLVIGLALTALLTILNYRGIGLSATFQNWTTFGTLALFVVFVAFGASKGSAANLPPLFTHGRFVSVWLVMQVVLYYMTGYEWEAKDLVDRSLGFSGLGSFT